MIQHAYYEELCALAVSGQIAPDQLRSLKEHMTTCAGCVNAFADFANIAAQVLEFPGSRKPPEVPSGMTARFTAKAHSEGIPLSSSPDDGGTRKKWLRNSTYVSSAVAAVLILLLGLKAQLLYWPSVIPTRPKVETPAQAIIDQPRADLLRDNGNLTRQLEDLRNRVNELAADLNAKRQALNSAQADKLQANAREVELEKAKADLRQELAAHNSQIAQLTAEFARSQTHVEQLVSAKTNGEIQIQEAQSELTDLHEKLSYLSEELNKSQQLSAAAEEAKELIVARQLHIVDVHDNANTSRPGPFGRIFYTEGKKLVFYAYDLGDPRQLNAKVSFWVWGEKNGTANKPKHLGVLQADDRQEHRWVVTFDDPRVLAQINTVFVTAESNKKEITQPSGNRILVAFLDGEPNHP